MAKLERDKRAPGCESHRHDPAFLRVHLEVIREAVADGYYLIDFGGSPLVDLPLTEKVIAGRMGIASRYTYVTQVNDTHGIRIKRGRVIAGSSGPHRSNFAHDDFEQYGPPAGFVKCKSCLGYGGNFKPCVRCGR
jgi:hypothetical protein